MHCATPASPLILAPGGDPLTLGLRSALSRWTKRDGSMPPTALADAGSLPLSQLAERARLGEDPCRLELLARWCADPQADPRLGDAVWEQFRRLLYRWIQTYLAQRALGAELLREADEPVNDALDSLAAQVLMRFFQSQAGTGLAARFPSMGHINRFLARVTWTVTSEHLDAQLRRRRHDAPWPEEEAGPGGEAADGAGGGSGMDGGGGMNGGALAPSGGTWTIEPGQAVEEALSGTGLWRRLRAHCHDDAEWVVMVERFVRERPPREILQRHAELFPSIGQIYKTLERVLARLRKDPELSAVYGGAP